jgi:putative SOS response-associated peptidase YedK
MCGRGYRKTSTAQLAQHFGAEDRAQLTQRYNIPPTVDVAAVRSLPGTGQRELVALRWGLLPPWVKDDGKRPPLLANARAETVHDKPAFRSAFKRRRCLVLFDGFYEWLRVGKTDKRPYLIRLQDHAPMAMAGVWEHSETFSVNSTAVITTSANSAVAKVHDRMPALLLSEEDHRAWLEDDTDPEALKALLRPCPPGALELFEVQKRVNSVKNDDEACLEPA